MKELLSAHQFPCYVGDHAITCQDMSSQGQPDDDLTIVCVKDGQGRVHSEVMKPQETQEGMIMFHHTCCSQTQPVRMYPTDTDTNFSSNNSFWRFPLWKAIASKKNYFLALETWMIFGI